MTVADEIHIRTVNRVGRITLTRPDALNALTYDMVIAMETALDSWLDGDQVDLILVDAKGERAFCAGGDIAKLYATGKAGDYEYGRKFWTDEYRLNAKISNLSVPYIALMDGINMGGGVGISAHGSDRMVTERSMIAMPECGIGLVPDVGGSKILANAPGYLGEYLAMTGYRMNAGDAVLAGFADGQIKSDDKSKLISRVEETGELYAIGEFVQPADAPALKDQLAGIDTHFNKENALACLQSLESDRSEWAQKTAKLIRRSSPLSVACAFEIIRRARSMETLEEVLALEYRFTHRAMAHGDMLEGIRALIIDKDRKPNWQCNNLEEVTHEQIEAMLAPLGENELKL